MKRVRILKEKGAMNRTAKELSRKTGILILLFLIMIAVSGCAKENKYVNVGVNMSTAGMSLYLTNTVNEFQKISNYVFFSNSSQESLEKIRLDKQGIDITYLPAKDIGLIKADDALKVVFPDCFNDNGELEGVWVAKEAWLENAPNYSYRFILGLAQSADYRASHMNMSYNDAIRSVIGVRDVDWEKYPETMQYCAVYADSNKEALDDIAFEGKSAEEMLAMFENFETGSGEGYELCRSAYTKYCGTDSKSFEEMFDLSPAVKALKEAVGDK